jgi:hypothetical protein
MPERGDLRQTLRAILADSRSTDSAAARICAACTTLLPVSGAAISITASAGQRGTVCTSDAVMERIEDLQFGTGVGPCVDAITSGAAVLAPHLDASLEARWPGFAYEASRAGAQALFALPLRVGAIRLGAMDLYRDTPGGLSTSDLTDALLIADAATLAVISMHDVTPAGDLDDEWWDLVTFYRVEIHQATGMLMDKLDVPAVEALARLRARAFASGIGVLELARQIVARDLDVTATFSADGVAEAPD